MPGYLLRRASSSLIAELNQRLAGIDVNHTDASLLILIDANPGLTQSDAARMLGIQRANMVGLVARVEGRGLLVRERVDGRSQALLLSTDGKAVLARVLAVIHAFEASLLERVPADLRPHVVPILRHLWGEGRENAGGSSFA
ncbi:MAG: MarR family transcriptional regulator [Sphingopyxis sp.]|nr:MarR family transcriptional regulator [Sphingopyxis sp.]